MVTDRTTQTVERLGTRGLCMEDLFAERASFLESLRWGHGFSL